MFYILDIFIETVGSQYSVATELSVSAAAEIAAVHMEGFVRFLS